VFQPEGTRGVTPSSKTRRSAQSWYHPRCQQWKPGGWRGEFEGMPSAKANGPGWPSFPSASHLAQRMSPMQALHTLRGTAVRAQNACVAMKATAFAIAEPNRLPLEGRGVELTQGPGISLDSTMSRAPTPNLRSMRCCFSYDSYFRRILHHSTHCLSGCLASSAL
jgi:hypothetical protein